MSSTTNPRKRSARILAGVVLAGCAIGGLGIAFGPAPTVVIAGAPTPEQAQQWGDIGRGIGDTLDRELIEPWTAPVPPAPVTVTEAAPPPVTVPDFSDHSDDSAWAVIELAAHMTDTVDLYVSFGDEIDAGEADELAALVPDLLASIDDVSTHIEAGAYTTAELSSLTLMAEHGTTITDLTGEHASDADVLAAHELFKSAYDVYLSLPVAS